MNYIATHKNFEIPQGLKGEYTIITDGTDLQNNYQYPIIKADNELMPLKHAYSEGMMIYDIWKKDNDSEYIGINHYRRYLEAQFIEALNENVLPIPMAFNMDTQYAACHNIADLTTCRGIIELYYPEYNPNVQIGFFPCNMAILDHDTFNEWCTFIFGVLDIFNEKMKFTSDEDVRKYIEQYFPNNVDYQSRLHAFLLERLSTIYFANKFNNKKVRYSQILITN